MMVNPTDRILEQDGFLYGVNVPWLDKDSFGRGIGRNAHLDPDCSRFSLERFKNTFYNCKAIGFNCVRLWILPFFEGIMYDEQGMAIGLDEEFVRNIRTVYELAEAMDINLMITFHAHSRYLMRERVEAYKQYSKILFFPEHMQSYCEHCIAPLARYFSNKSHVIMLDMIAEPEGDIEGDDGNYMEYGGTWKTMRTLMKMMGDTCKKYAPQLPVTAASGWKYYESLRKGKYNDIGLDYIGVDIYNDTGELEPVDTLNCDKPVWLAEFGLSQESSTLWDEDLLTNATLSFYRNAIGQGYVGAFFWMYGYPEPWDALSLEDKDGRLRSVADELHFLFMDRINQNRGIRYEEPVILYTNHPDYIAWFARRGAAAYRLERSEDLTRWETVQHVEAAPSQKRVQTQDASALPGHSYYYRVAAVLPDGDEVFSKTSPLCIAN